MISPPPVYAGVVDQPIVASNTALVIEGGGTRNSYTAPLIEKLISDEVIVGWVGGISAGATLSVAYLSGNPQRAQQAFVDAVVNPSAGGWLSFARGRGYFDAEYIYEKSTAPDGPYPYDYEAIARHPAQLGLSAVRADTGETVWWSRDDFEDFAGLIRRVRASSTMPVLMPIAEVDGHPYVDGALGRSGGIPVDQAQAAGFERFVIIRSRPRGFRRAAPKFHPLIATVLYKYPHVAELLATRHDRYNATVEQIDHLEAAGQAYVYYPEAMQVGNSERNVDKLRANYAAGQRQAQAEYPAIIEFLGRNG